MAGVDGCRSGWATVGDCNVVVDVTQSLHGIIEMPETGTHGGGIYGFVPVPNGRWKQHYPENKMARWHDGKNDGMWISAKNCRRQRSMLRCKRCWGGDTFEFHTASLQRQEFNGSVKCWLGGIEG